jgi:hypothetical protein
MFERYFRKSSMVFVDPNLFRVWIMFDESRSQQNLFGINTTQTSNELLPKVIALRFRTHRDGGSY